MSHFDYAPRRCNSLALPLVFVPNQERKIASIGLIMLVRWEDKALAFPRDYNAVVDFVDRQVNGGNGDKLAFADSDQSLTYGALQAETKRLANLLSAQGLKREDRVAMLVLDTVEFPVIFWGAIRAGVVPVALNTLLTTDQYRYILSDSRARSLFVSAPLLAVVEPVLQEMPELASVFVIGGEAGSHLDFRAELAKQPDQAAIAATVVDETAFWLYSSGSTGMPKGVLHVHSSLMETAKLYGEGVLGIREDDLVFSAAKLFFAYGLGNGMSFPMSVGATTLLLPDRPTPAAVFEMFEQHQPTIFFGVPTLYAAMLAHAGDKPMPGMAKLRQCVSAGEALPKDVGEAWQDRFGVEILDGVGTTELLHIFLSNRPGEVRYGTSGRAVPGYELNLIDETGQTVADGEIGELLVKAPSAASGYWNQRAKSRATFGGDWTRTGDKYIRDAEGCYQYCGRTDDMFKVGGQWLSPFEVESALIAHEAVLEAAVVPAEDDDGLLKPKAFVVLQPDHEGDDLFEALKVYVKAAVGPWKYPRWINVVDSLPKTATGKIQRYKLRDRP